MDQALGLDDRPFEVLVGGVRPDGQGTPLMKAGLPPYDQQPNKAQVIPEPEVVDVPEPEEEEPEETPIGVRNPTIGPNSYR